MFFKSSILVQIILYCSYSLSSSIWKDINVLLLSLKILTYPLLLGSIKTNGLTTSSKYPIKYLELFFASINFEITILSTSDDYIIKINIPNCCLHHKILLLLLLFYQIPTLVYYQKICNHMF